MRTDPDAEPEDDRVRPLFVPARDLVKLLSSGPPLLVDAEELARLLAVSVATLHRMKSAGKIGPRPLRLGARVLWRRATVEAWLVASEAAGALLPRERWDATCGAGGASRCPPNHARATLPDGSSSTR